MAEQASTTWFERLVFGLTRFIVGLLALVSLTGIVLCGLYLAGKLNKSSEVSYSDVRDAMAGGKRSASTKHQVARDPDGDFFYKVPSDLEPYFQGDENRKVFDSWMKALDSDEMRSEFATEMATTGRDARRDGIDTSDAINKYKELKFERISASTADRYQSLAMKAAAAGTLIALLFMLVMLALMLVLLATERHARGSLAIAGDMRKKLGDIEASNRATVLLLRPRDESEPLVTKPRYGSAEARQAPDLR